MFFADDTVLVQSDNHLGKLQNSFNCEMTKVMDWLTANKLSLSISKTEYMLITNKQVSTKSFAINAKGNRIERTLVYKYLGVSGASRPGVREGSQIRGRQNIFIISLVGIPQVLCDNRWVSHKSGYFF